MISCIWNTNFRRGNNSTRVANDRERDRSLSENPEGDHERDSFHWWDAGTLHRCEALPILRWPMGELIIDFTSPDELVENIDEIQEFLTRQYPDAYVKVETL